MLRLRSLVWSGGSDPCAAVVVLCCSVKSPAGAGVSALGRRWVDRRSRLFPGRRHRPRRVTALSPAARVYLLDPEAGMFAEMI